jgi:hypothetical protein
MSQDSPNLKVISNPAAERRRVPRLSVTHEQFRESRTGKVFSVGDLSTEGLGLRLIDGEDLAHFPLASVIEGLLNLKREKHAVRFRVVRVGAGFVGGRFEGLSAESQAALARFFDPKSLGAELRPMPGAPDGAMWYHGASGTDLLLWRNPDGSYQRFTLYVMSGFVQWEESRGATTGLVAGPVESSEERGFVRLETVAITPDAQPDAGKLEVAKALILSSNLPQDLRRWCVRQLSPA